MSNNSPSHSGSNVANISLSVFSLFMILSVSRHIGVQVHCLFTQFSVILVNWSTSNSGKILCLCNKYKETDRLYLVNK